MYSRLPPFGGNAVVADKEKIETMGVYVTANIVQRVNEEVISVKEEAMPESKPIYFLNDLIFLDDLKSSLLKITSADLDLSFFTKLNAETYGNLENKNTSFSPKAVINCINTIRKGFEINGDKFIRTITYEGIFDDEGKRISQVFVETEEGKLFWKKKTDRWASINAYEDKISLQWYDDENDKWGVRIDLSKEKPVLYYLNYEGQNKVKGDSINYEVRKKRFYDQIKSELDNIEELANYAVSNNYELQMRQD